MEYINELISDVSSFSKSLGEIFYKTLETRKDSFGFSEVNSVKKALRNQNNFLENHPLYYPW